MAVVSGTDPSRGGRQHKLETLDAFDGRSLTLKDVCDRLDVGPDAASRYAKDGTLPGAFKIGSHWRIPAQPFEAWVRGWWTPAGDGPFENWYAALKDTTGDCG